MLSTTVNHTPKKFHFFHFPPRRCHQSLNTTPSLSSSCPIRTMNTMNGTVNSPWDTPKEIKHGGGRYGGRQAPCHWQWQMRLQKLAASRKFWIQHNPILPPCTKFLHAMHWLPPISSKSGVRCATYRTGTRREQTFGDSELMFYAAGSLKEWHKSLAQFTMQCPKVSRVQTKELPFFLE